MLADDWEGIVLNAPTNLAFAGHELDVLVATSVGETQLASAPADTPGLPLRGRGCRERARFAGRGVVVTGAARGIGRAIVAAFLGEGARVVAVDVLPGVARLEASSRSSPTCPSRGGRGDGRRGRGGWDGSTCSSTTPR